MRDGETKKRDDDTWEEADVERIYQAYPRHVGKIAAKKAVRKALTRIERAKAGEGDRDWAVAWLIGRTETYAASDVGQGKCFNDPPHPATWFNRGSYDDEDGEWQARDGVKPVRRLPTDEPGKYDDIK